MTASDGDRLDESRAPFLEHLDELRWRLWRALISVFIASIICFIFAEALGAWIIDPIVFALKNHGQAAQLSSRTLQGGFMFSFKIALIFGLFSRKQCAEQCWHDIWAG